VARVPVSKCASLRNSPSQGNPPLASRKTRNINRRAVSCQRENSLVERDCSVSA